MDLDAPGLENQVVRLDVFGPEHWDHLRESGAIEDMWRWMPSIPGGVNFDAYLRQTQKNRARGVTVPFAVFCQSEGRFAGVCEFGLVDELHRRVRISSCWHPPEKRGTLVFPATQCLLMKRALEWGARRIAWTVDARNIAALEAFERLGAQREGVLRAFMRMTDGSWADVQILSMLRDEAKAAVERLEAKFAAEC